MARRNAYPPAPPSTAPPPDPNADPVAELDRMLGRTAVPINVPPLPALAESLAEVPSRAHAAPAVRLEEAQPLVTKAITFSVTLDAIAELAEECKGLPDPASGPEALEDNRKARARIRDVRFGVEHRRKDLIDDAVRYQRRANDAARVLREALEKIENPIDERIKAVERAKEAARLAAEHAERERQQHAEAKRLEEQRAAQAEEEQRQRVERQRIDAENERLRKEREAIEKREREQREREAAAQRERDEAARLAKEEADRIAREAAESEAAERRKPDAEKLRAFAQRLIAITNDGPELATPEAGEEFDRAVGGVLDVAERLEAFGVRPRRSP